jgi:hypothetical protein
MIDDLIAASEDTRLLAESPAFRDRHLSPEDVADATAAIEAQPDHTRYHALLALRRDAPEAYRAVPAATRASVLADALARQTVVNDFGLLSPDGSHDGVAGAALLESGEAAIEPLRPLLDDQRPAPSHGSEDATISRIFGLRRSDYAYRYLALITGTDAAFVPDVKERDRRIAALRDRL